MIIFILFLLGLELCAFWTFPHNDSKSKATLGHFSLKWMRVSCQRLRAWIQWTSAVLAQQAGMQIHTYNKRKWYIWQSDWFIADAIHFPVRESKLLVCTVSCNLLDFDWQGVAHFNKEGVNLRQGLFIFDSLFLSLYIHAPEGQREWPSLSHLPLLLTFPLPEPNPCPDHCWDSHTNTSMSFFAH